MNLEPINSIFDKDSEVYKKCAYVRYMLKKFFKDIPIPLEIEDIYLGRGYYYNCGKIILSNGEIIDISDIHDKLSLHCKFHVILYEAKLYNITEEELVGILVYRNKYQNICYDTRRNILYIVDRLYKLHIEYGDIKNELVEAIRNNMIYKYGDEIIVNDYNNKYSNVIDIYALDVLYCTMNAGIHKIVGDKIDIVGQIIEKYKW